MPSKSKRSKAPSKAAGANKSNAAAPSPRRAEKPAPPPADAKPDESLPSVAAPADDDLASWRGFLPRAVATFCAVTLGIALILNAHGAYERRLAGARALAAKGEAKEAIARYRKLARERPDNLGASFELANLLSGQGRAAGDFAALDEAAKLYSSVDAQSGLHAESRVGIAEIALYLAERGEPKNMSSGDALGAMFNGAPERRLAETEAALRSGSKDAPYLARETLTLFLERASIDRVDAFASALGFARPPDMLDAKLEPEELMRRFFERASPADRASFEAGLVREFSAAERAAIQALEAMARAAPTRRLAEIGRSVDRAAPASSLLEGDLLIGYLGDLRRQPGARVLQARALVRAERWPDAAKNLSAALNDPAWGAAARQAMEELEAAAFGEAIDWKSLNPSANVPPSEASPKPAS